MKNAILTGANLSEANLGEADLLGANLSETDLRGAKLIGAVLGKVNFSGANLSEINFRSSSLVEVDFSKANLRGASLIQADLTRVNFTGANLNQANLSKAKLILTKLTDARFEGTDLTNITIDSNTLSDLPQKLLAKYAETFMVFNLSTDDEFTRIIKRSIEFSPENHQAGLSILNYFGEVVRQKYPDLDVGITIEQHGSKVTMIIETPEGLKDTIEETLDDYGLVIRRKMDAKFLFNNPNHILKLEHKLDLAEMELRHTRDLLYSERKQYGKRVETLESNVQRLTKQIDEGIKSNQSLIRIIENSIKVSNLNTRDALRILEEKLLHGINESDENEVKEAFLTVQNEDPNLFKQLYDLIVKGSISGTAGNFLYQWILAISSGFPI